VGRGDDGGRTFSGNEGGNRWVFQREKSLPFFCSGGKKKTDKGENLSSEEKAEKSRVQKKVEKSKSGKKKKCV